MFLHSHLVTLGLNLTGLCCWSLSSWIYLIIENDEHCSLPSLVWWYPTTEIYLSFQVMASIEKNASSMWCLIRDLHPTKMKLHCAIKLRLIRIYELPAPANKKEIISLECIFHDFEGERIHVTIPRMFIKKWQPTLKEGHLFGIKNFMVIHNFGKYKITTHMYKLKFNIETDVKRMVEVDFPSKLYIFKPFEEIEALDEIKDGELFDVIGVLLTKSDAQTINCQNGSQRKLIELMLQDTEGKRISCTLWEDYVDQFLHSFEKNGQPSNIIILQLGRPNMFKGKMIMQSSFHVSKVLVNANIPEVADFRQRVVIASDQCTTIIGCTSQEATSCLTNETADAQCELKTIEELFFANEIGTFWIEGKVVNVDLEDGWFYISCKKCNKKLSKQEQQFYCKKCKKNDISGNIRYRLVLDVVDETGGAAVVLWDRDCVQLIGKSAAEIMQHEKEGIHDLPDAIHNAIMERKFLFKIPIKARPDDDYNGSYSVMKVTSDLTYINAYNQKKSESQENNYLLKEDNNALVDNIEETTPMDTPSSSKLDMGGEWTDEEQVKRSLTDAFSSTIPLKKSKVFIKKEKE